MSSTSRLSNPLSVFLLRWPGGRPSWLRLRLGWQVLEHRGGGGGWLSGPAGNHHKYRWARPQILRLSRIHFLNYRWTLLHIMVRGTNSWLIVSKEFYFQQHRHQVRWSPHRGELLADAVCALSGPESGDVASGLVVKVSNPGSASDPDPSPGPRYSPRQTSPPGGE